MPQPAKKYAREKPELTNEPATGSPAGNPSYLAHSLTNASIDSMIALDADLKITVWNDTTALWSGLKSEDVAGRPFLEVFPKAAAIHGLKEALDNALKGRKSFLHSREGFYLKGHYEAHYVPLLDKQGQVTGVLQILHDVAHRIKAENELIALNRQLKQQYKELQLANDELATFAKIASHDLKEPLRKIYTFSELILVHDAPQLSNSGRSNFRRIQKSVQRMGLLTDDIVNFAEINTSREPLDEVDLSGVLFNAAEPLRTAIAQSEAMIISDELPHIQGRREALVQLFRQLISNALKFRGEDTKPRIYIACALLQGEDIPHREALEGQAYYRISFRDNGIGFEPEFSEKIFGMFQRLHPDGEYKGSGMGLSIAQKVAQMHNGFIIAESIPGAGSTFHCYLQHVA